ncbi:1131_t:CDS:2, partial [Entrophospora sp. SA101]
NKGIIYMMDRPGGVVSRLTKKANLEAPIYIEEKIESDELETQVFRKNIIGVRLPFAETTPTPRLSLETN